MAALGDYGGPPPVTHGARILSVAEGSPAQRAGLREAHVVFSADGHELRDILDWQWYADGDVVHLRVAQWPFGHSTVADQQRYDLSQCEEPHEIVLTRKPGESWGIEFGAAIFDRVRTCRNDCAFCFMSQLPTGMRRSLYLRDDDYRLSFLQGNFVTLTNLTDDDVDRIIEQRLSPLHVSVHSTNPEVRRALVCAREDRALERLDALLEGDVDVHVQIVLVPGVNDGDELTRTLTWLAEREGILSVGIVPLGYTRYQELFSASYEVPAAALSVIDQVTAWQTAFRERDGTGQVYLADEFYLNAGVPVPQWELYDGAPQYENGIGMVSSFLAETADHADSDFDRSKRTLITGTLFALVLAAVLKNRGLSSVSVLAVENRYFGGNVTVTGLLTGLDIVDAIRDHGAKGEYCLPDVIFNADGITLDDMTLRDIAQHSGAHIRLVSSDPAGLLLAPR